MSGPMSLEANTFIVQQEIWSKQLIQSSSDIRRGLTQTLEKLGSSCGACSALQVGHPARDLPIDYDSDTETPEIDTHCSVDLWKQIMGYNTVILMPPMIRHIQDLEKGHP